MLRSTLQSPTSRTVRSTPLVIVFATAPTLTMPNAQVLGSLPETQAIATVFVLGPRSTALTRSR